MATRRKFSNFIHLLAKKKQTYFLISFTLCLIFIITFIFSTPYSHLSPLSSSTSSLENFHSIRQNVKPLKVDRIEELLDFELPTPKSKNNKKKKYFSKWEPQDFLERKITGFITNPEHPKPVEPDRPDSVCQDIRYENSLYFNVQERKQIDNLVEVRREVLKWDNEISYMVQDPKSEKDLSEEEIVKKHWYEFGHMSVWFEPGNCYLMYSRIVYTDGSKNNPIISLIKATAYDKDWNELIGKKIPLNGINIPDNLEKELALLDDQLEFDYCQDFEQPSIDRNKCLEKKLQSTLESKHKKEKILKNYFITYPKVLDFPFELRKTLGGPEDPHIILRMSPHGTQEPILIYNLDNNHYRRIYAVMPHRKNPQPIEFTLNEGNGVPLTLCEKNWTPFFLPERDDVYSQLSNGYIHFVYSYYPLRILRCSLDDGKCDETFSQETLSLIPHNKDGDLRGGTQFVPLPKPLPDINKKHVWISIAKTHTKDCGCGEDFYRAVLVMMVESFGVYHMELVSPGIDFSIEPLNFAGTGRWCDSKNVLTPNSIISWDVISKNVKHNSFEDYLVLSVSEADAVSKLVTVKGVLNYILNVYKQKDIAYNFPVDEVATDLISNVRLCVSNYTEQVCKDYGLSHIEKKMVRE